MQSHALTSQSQIIKQLKQIKFSPMQCPSNRTAVTLDTNQEKLNQIAEQAGDFAYGMGVILGKLIENGKTLCKQIAANKQNVNPGFLDYFFSKSSAYTFSKGIATEIADSKLLKSCEQHVREAEDELQRLTEKSYRPILF